MNIFFRVLLAIYAFCLAIISAISILITFNPPVFKEISYFLEEVVLGSTAPRIAMMIISLIFFILSVTFLMSGVRSNKDKKAVSKYTNIGEVRISLNSIENIALNAARKINGIKESKAHVVKINDNVSISINLIVMPDINIPSLSEDIQMRVKKSVEESSGIGVNDVKVVVDGIFSGNIYRARVE